MIFSPYSFSIAFDYKTTVANGAGDRLYFSTNSDLDDGATNIDGFQITMYNQYLYLKTQKELAWPGYYFAPGPANVGAYDFTSFVRMVFVFNHSFNHTEGDKNNVKIFVNGQMLLNQDIADNKLTQAERTRVCSSQTLKSCTSTDTETRACPPRRSTTSRSGETRLHKKRLWQLRCYN